MGIQHYLVSGPPLPKVCTTDESSDRKSFCTFYTFYTFYTFF